MSEAGAERSCGNGAFVLDEDAGEPVTHRPQPRLGLCANLAEDSGRLGHVSRLLNTPAPNRRHRLASATTRKN
jgi:hypothetical protein